MTGWALNYDHALHRGAVRCLESIPLSTKDFSDHEAALVKAKIIWAERASKEFRDGKENPRLIWSEPLYPKENEGE